MISRNDIETAHARIATHVHRTPVLTCESINRVAGAQLYFKCENFQKIGAFKIRGAMNAALSLSPEQLANGLATHSSGNHAQAIAFAARKLNTRAYIVMPSNSPSVKVNAVKEYGAAITFCEPNQQAREDTLGEIVRTTNAAFIHPYNDIRVIAGQATAARELIGDTPALDSIFAPVGGGGLLSGTLLSAHYFSPGTAVFAGEPEGAADAILSIKNNRIESASYVDSIADGLLTKLGDQTFPIIKQYVKDIYTVSEQEIIDALRLVYERMKLIVEPSAVVPLAAVLKNKDAFRGQQIGIILSGGNIDLAKLSGWLMQE